MTQPHTGTAINAPAPRGGKRGAPVRIMALRTFHGPAVCLIPVRVPSFGTPTPAPEPPGHGRRTLLSNTDGSVQRP
jgi:hypothetical protein